MKKLYHVPRPPSNTERNLSLSLIATSHHANFSFEANLPVRHIFDVVLFSFYGRYYLKDKSEVLKLLCQKYVLN